ncbi:MAG: hypothetical protein ACJ8G2_07695 [Burkholderiales bacterium]
MSAFALGWSAKPRALGLLQLREDPQYRRIPHDQRVAFVEAALEDGHAMAKRIVGEYGSDPYVIASVCNVPVRCSQSDAGFGSTVIYAEYNARPPAITLYLPAIQALDRLIVQQGGSCGGSVGTLPIFLAHELYHHFDGLRGRARLSRRHAVRIFSVGTWHWTSGVSSLCEIAAGAFAQELLELPFHPKHLDSFLRVDVVPELEGT